MNKMKYFGIDYCNGQVLFFLCFRRCKNDRHITRKGVVGNPGTTTPKAPRPTQSMPKTM